MRIETLVVLFLSGCSGYDPPGGGGGEQLAVRARTVEPGPHRKHSIVELAADASGGVAPYLFTWQDPAATTDRFRGHGQIDSGGGGVIATVSAVDALGHVATDSIEIVVEGETLPLTIMIQGSGRIDVVGVGICTREQCTFSVEAGASIQLVASSLGESDFLGWSGCSSSTDATIAIQVAAPIVCTARFGQGTTCESAPPPIADVVVRPELHQPPFAQDASAFFVVPSNAHVLIDGLGSRFFGGEGLTFGWTVTWDPLDEVPDFSVAFFEIRTPGLPDVRSDVVLTVTDDCGRTATATASYITD